MFTTYRSNNSGGYYWICDGDWEALQKEGWKIHWEWMEWFENPRSS